MDNAIRSMLPVLLLAVAACGSDGDDPVGSGNRVTGSVIEGTREDGRPGFGSWGVDVGQAPQPECEVEVFIPRFGIVPATFELVFRNLRPDAPCTIRDLRLCEGTDPAYSLPGGGYDRVLVPGGDEVRFPVHFASESSSCLEPGEIGCIEFELEPSVDGHRSIPLTCPGFEYGALPTPGELDFGPLTPGCTTGRKLEIINISSDPLHLRATGFGEGTSGEFFLTAEPIPGAAVQPGSSHTFSVGYRPRDRGVDAGTIWVQYEELPEPLVVDLVGGSDAFPVQRDSFRQLARPKVDMLVVIDNGTTMGPESAHLVADLGGLADVLALSGLDFHLAVTTTGLVAGGPGCPGGANGGEDGRFVPVDGARPRILDRNTPDLRATFEANLAVGTCHSEPPQLLEATLRALTPPLSSANGPADGNSGFLRPDAFLLVIAVSDRPDASPDDDLAYYTALQALKGQRNPYLFDFLAITGDRTAGCTAGDGRSAAAGDRLIEMAERFGGTHLSICGGPWLDHFALASTGNGPTACFHLGKEPVDLDGDGAPDRELRVYLDGMEEPAVTDGVPAWRYQADANAVCFGPGHVPAEGVTIEVEYEGYACF